MTRVSHCRIQIQTSKITERFIEFNYNTQLFHILSVCNTHQSLKMENKYTKIYSIFDHSKFGKHTTPATPTFQSDSIYVLQGDQIELK